MRSRQLRAVALLGALALAAAAAPFPAGAAAAADERDALAAPAAGGAPPRGAAAARRKLPSALKHVVHSEHVHKSQQAARHPTFLNYGNRKKAEAKALEAASGLSLNHI